MSDDATEESAESAEPWREEEPSGAVDAIETDDEEAEAADDAEPPRAARGNAGKGRPKGSRNKVTMGAKQAIALAAEAAGGVERLREWMLKNDANEKIFWATIYPRLLPYKIDGESEDGPRLVEVYTWLPPAK